MSSQSDRKEAEGVEVAGGERADVDAATRRRMQVAAMRAEVELHERREREVGDDVAALEEAVTALEAEVEDLESEVTELEDALAAEVDRLGDRCERIVRRHARAQADRDRDRDAERAAGPLERLRALLSR